MSEPLPNQETTAPASGSSHNFRTIMFMVILSFVCALILSVLASALAEPKEVAKELDRSTQMMIAAKILDHNGYFLIGNEKGEYHPAKYVQGGYLEPSDKKIIATKDQLLDIYKRRVIPMLVTNDGNIVTFETAKIKPDEYISKFKKPGYYLQPYKLVYAILPNTKPETKDKKAAYEEYVIPVNGFGLWDAIYGYLAIKPDGNTVIGISWYDQKETPGLGANIADPPWQSLFPGKHIFQESADGTTNFKTAPLGITVVKGKVAEVLGDSPKALSAVDGMAGATLTGNGVTEAYQHVLSAYRPFFIKLHEASAKKEG